MGKQPGPSSEELEFIFRCFLRNLPTREVLEEMEDTEFPHRNPRFINERRRHFDVVRKVLEGEIQTNVAPIITNQRREHFGQLTEIAKMLIVGLEHIEPWEDGKDAIYVGPRELDAVIPIEELSTVLDKNLNAACVRFSEYDVYHCFASHLEEEHTEIKSKGFKEYLAWYPLKSIQMLSLLIRRGTFKGTCPVCQDW